MANLTSIFLFGFASGVPFLLILSTLSVWLAEVGVSKTMIGLLAWVSVPYACKFLWGVLVDRVQIPILTRMLGVRRSWILCAQIGVWLALIGLGNTDPSKNILYTAIFALLVGFASATQDIATEAYRIEILPKSQVGVGASLSVLGYRIGMLCSGAGTLFLAAYFNSWNVAYHCIAAFMSIGIIATLSSKEPQNKNPPLKLVFWKVIKALMHKLDWQIIFPFILSYKIADTVLNVMSMPFLVEIGFDNFEIASVAKTFGISAMILGGLIGGYLSTKISLRQNLLLCVLLQCAASGLFVVQAAIGRDLSFLFISMGVENFACGMSQVALVAYLSHLCTQRSTAMHYALLTSFASFVRVSLSSLSGWMADHLAWPQFYSLVCISCLPSLLLLYICAKHFAQVDRSAAPEVLTNTGEILDVD
jgi:PAT family beta-lactamase induction signal transducer AmpG